MRHMTGTDGLAVAPNQVAEPPPAYGGTGYTAGSARDYDRAHALDVPQLFRLPARHAARGVQEAGDGRSER
jgi:type I restriction enzyme R subunit